MREQAKDQPTHPAANAEIGKLYIKPGLGHLRLPDLRAQRLEDLYTAIRRISGARLRRIHDVVRAYLTQRARKAIIPRNPANHIELPVGKRPEGLVWTDERVERWLRTGRRPARS